MRHSMKNIYTKMVSWSPVTIGVERTSGNCNASAEFPIQNDALLNQKNNYFEQNA